jgi:hypothetical protein
MRWFWLAVYRLSRVLTRVLFGLGHKIQWLGWKASDRAGLGVRRRPRKPLTAVRNGLLWVVGKRG